MTNERMKGKTNTFRHVYIQREMGGRNEKKYKNGCVREIAARQVLVSSSPVPTSF